MHRLPVALYLTILCLLINASQTSARDVHKHTNKNATTKTVATGTSITIYNQNRALIRQTRSVNLKDGLNQIDWNEIPSTIDLSSVNLRSANSDNAIEVKEQNYQYDLLSTQTILARSVGKTVYLRHFFPDGHSEEKPVILMSAAQTSSGVDVVKADNRYILNPHDQVEINDLPPGLVTQPKLTFTVQTTKAGTEDLSLTYAANEINWQCDYSIILNGEQNKFDLVALATIDNHSGVSFKDTSLKLLAGSVQTIRPMPRAYEAKAGLMMASGNASQPKESSFADYHLYTFDYPVNINNNETKRLSLVSGNSIPVVKKYIFDEQVYGYLPPKRKLSVQVKLEFQNDQQNNLGKPLPAGQVKVYQEDAQHDLQSIGEDRIEHTPVGEKVTVKLGEAFDVTAEKNKISSEQISEHLRREKYKVTFRNHLDHDVTVTDLEHSAYEFPVLTSDASFTKVDSNTFQFDVKIPASGMSEITYQLDSKI